MTTLQSAKLIRNIVCYIFYSAISICSFAQEKNLDTTTTKIDTASVVNTPADRLKDVKKLDDERIKLPADLIFKLKKMGPDELVNLSERFIYNDRVEDENGDKYEVTITVRLGFSQDMITGIVKEVPLYNTASKETNIIQIKIPVQFCCSTPIDTLHKKQHCGKMSELNDFEDKEHCKVWIQKDKAQQDKEAAKIIADSIAKMQSKTNLKKKGSTTNKAGVDSTGGFGKPIPKGKISKKNKNGKEEIEVTDSTGKIITPILVPDNNGKKSNKIDNKKKGKTIQKATDSVNYRPVKPEDTEEEFGKSIPKNKVSKKTKKEKEETEIIDSTDKKIEPVIVPNKKEKKSKSSSKNEKQEKGKAIQPSTDSVNYRPENPEPIIKDSSVNDFGKKPDNKKKKRG
jgi:hypothetical protein